MKLFCTHRLLLDCSQRLPESCLDAEDDGEVTNEPPRVVADHDEELILQADNWKLPWADLVENRRPDAPEAAEREGGLKKDHDPVRLLQLLEQRHRLALEELQHQAARESEARFRQYQAAQWEIQSRAQLKEVAGRDQKEARATLMVQETCDAEAKQVARASQAEVAEREDQPERRLDESLKKMGNILLLEIQSSDEAKAGQARFWQDLAPQQDMQWRSQLEEVAGEGQKEAKAILMVQKTCDDEAKQEALECQVSHENESTAGKDMVKVEATHLEPLGFESMRLEDRNTQLRAMILHRCYNRMAR